MPTILSHPAPVLALGAGLGFSRLPARLLLLAVLFSIVPDLDVLSFHQGIPYTDVTGHRGLTHSLFFAVLAGCFGACIAPWLHCRRALAGFLLFLATASHIALDAATSGGQGVAAFWPFSAERYFFPWRPIRVSPISAQAFLSSRGLEVLLSELRWVWLPALGLALVLRLWRFFSPKIFPPRRPLLAGELKGPEDRKGEILARLSEIDLAKIRPTSAIAAGTATDFDRQKLEDLEAEAVALRAELAAMAQTG
jgi:inner membrane protein